MKYKKKQKTNIDVVSLAGLWWRSCYSLKAVKTKFRSLLKTRAGEKKEKTF